MAASELQQLKNERKQAARQLNLSVKGMDTQLNLLRRAVQRLTVHRRILQLSDLKQIAEHLQRIKGQITGVENKLSAATSLFRLI